MGYYAALASLTNLLDDILVQNRYPKYLLAKQPLIQSLHHIFHLLEESIQDYSSKGDEAADHVEGRIRELAYRVQDILDTQISYQYQLDLGETITPCQCMFCRRELDLAEVKQTSDSIVEELTAMKESHGNEDLQPEDYCVEEAIADVNITVGLDEYVTAINEQLCGFSSKLQIITIVGMGGIGKTTLARKTFDDPLVSYHFYCRAWTTISQEYNTKRALRSILTSLGIDGMYGEDEDALKERIYKSLKGQKYLIVLDDVWSTRVLDDTMRIFPSESNGSRVLLTTRLCDVAQYASNSSFIHEMHCLNVGESWNLLREKVFQQQCCPPNLEHIGKFIASKCGGLPLAIIVMAGILSNGRTPQYWEEVARNVASIWNRDDEPVFNILSLSFKHLSHQLKVCFLYMGCLLKEDEKKTDASRLTRLWIAEGFLKLRTNGTKTLEQMAEECLVDLVRRNLVQVRRSRSLSKVDVYSLHDVLREFCRKKALDEYFFHDRDWEMHLNGQGAENVRRIFPHSYSCQRHQASDTKLKLRRARGTCKPVRSIVWMHNANAADFERGGFKLLRALVVRNIQYNNVFIRAVSRMFHLKHLDLSVPKATRMYGFGLILKLPNLETLIIRGRHLTIPLTSKFWHMPRLRHLIIPRMTLPRIPSDRGGGVQDLEYLQTLDSVHNFIFTNKAIKRLFNLRRLAIECTEGGMINIWRKYSLNNVAQLQQLEDLTIRFKLSSGTTNFVLPSNLKKLSLRGCRLLWKEVTACAGSLPCLQSLKLASDAVVGEEWEPTEEDFLHLKYLELSCLDLKWWRSPPDGTLVFPRLEQIFIRKCKKLEEIPPEIGDIPTLKLIHVASGKSAARSAKLILKQQRSQGNDTLQIQTF